MLEMLVFWKILRTYLIDGPTPLKPKSSLGQAKGGFEKLHKILRNRRFQEVTFELQVYSLQTSGLFQIQGWQHNKAQKSRIFFFSRTPFSKCLLIQHCVLMPHLTNSQILRP